MVDRLTCSGERKQKLGSENCHLLYFVNQEREEVVGVVCSLLKVASVPRDGDSLLGMHLAKTIVSENRRKIHTSSLQYSTDMKQDCPKIDILSCPVTTFAHQVKMTASQLPTEPGSSNKCV